MRRRLDNEVGPDQLVAVVDARGASALQVTRKVTLIKETALALNQVRPCPCAPPPYLCIISSGQSTLRCCLCARPQLFPSFRRDI